VPPDHEKLVPPMANVALNPLIGLPPAWEAVVKFTPWELLPEYSTLSVTVAVTVPLPEKVAE
jgi:hypothetical protein